MKSEPEHPFKIIAEILGMDSTDLNEQSAMGETYNWDSLNHVIIIGELEKKYKIKIPDSDIEKYFEMRAILTLYKSVKMNFGN